MFTISRKVGVGVLSTLLIILAVAGLRLREFEARASDSIDKKLNSLSDEERNNGWKLLFDGKTTNGWRAYKGKEVPDKWKVIDSALIFKPRDGTKGGDIMTVEEFDNFELRLEWKISPGGNSGIMYHVTEKADAPYGSGPEYQILDNAKHPDGKNPKTSAASCYALYAPSKDVTRPVGEWNQTRLIVNGKHVEHWLNGVKVVQYEIGNADWNKRVAKSKFKNWKQFAKASKGHIDLQDHGDEVAYRNIKIRSMTGKNSHR